MERRPPCRTLTAASLALALAVAAAPLTNAVPAQLKAKDCSRTSVGLTPLNDLGTGTYQDVQGGLYGAGSNQSPNGHAGEGVVIAHGIVPLEIAGAADRESGRFVVVSLGGNNANLQFAVFMTAVAADETRNPKLLLVNAATGGYDLRAAADPQSGYWDAVAESLWAAGSSPAQAQVAWMNFYVEASLGDFATSTDSTARLLTRAIQNARTRLPNLRQLYLTPGVYEGYTDDPDLTEPNAYWTGFAYRQVILSQVTGDSLNFDPARGPVVAPWIDWGPYLWADGLVPRSDSLTWTCDAYTGNGYVPSQLGRRQVADRLLAFVRASANTAPWYLADPTAHVPDDPRSVGPSVALLVAPNPASSAAWLRLTAVTGTWSLRVVDLQGRARRAFTGSGSADVAWDLRDGDGVRLPAGVYWAQLRTTAGGACKAVVVR